MYVPGDCNVLLIYVCDLCYRKKKTLFEKKRKSNLIQLFV